MEIPEACGSVDLLWCAPTSLIPRTCLLHHFGHRLNLLFQFDLSDPVSGTAQVGKALSLLSLLRFKTWTVRLKYLKMTVAEPPLQVCWTKASLGFFQATILCVPQLARLHETNEANDHNDADVISSMNLQSWAVTGCFTHCATASSMAELRIPMIAGPSRHLG